MRTWIYIITQVLQGEGDFSGHCPMSPLFKTLINHTEFVWGKVEMGWPLEWQMDYSCCHHCCTRQAWFQQPAPPTSHLFAHFRLSRSDALPRWRRPALPTLSFKNPLQKPTADIMDTTFIYFSVYGFESLVHHVTALYAKSMLYEPERELIHSPFESFESFVLLSCRVTALDREMS